MVEIDYNTLNKEIMSPSDGMKGAEGKFLLYRRTPANRYRMDEKI